MCNMLFCGLFVFEWESSEGTFGVKSWSPKGCTRKLLFGTWLKSSLANAVVVNSLTSLSVSFHSSKMKVSTLLTEIM